MRFSTAPGCAVLFSVIACSQLCSQSIPSPQFSAPPHPHRSHSHSRRSGAFRSFGLDGGNRLFVSALGNNSVEVIDISARVRDRSLSGIPRPQGVVYAPDAKKLFLASSQGVLRIFDGTNYNLLKEIDFHGDVDNLRYDASTHRV